ncbi:GvpL/GvpF family gas vesicle protein [Halobacterium wangiae]|uniref:GvpL/GvpF family gas vesicle protein n=1 Tax=Halobacterium wangiae TaxID=2902623 RepID=UPI001E30E886|nr:GvpL/GvpF family gas vesicle protein [Halobacterium wangiae]
MEEDALYAYGVIDGEAVEFETEGVGGAQRAYSVGDDSLFAVVTDVDTLDPERSDENVRAHNEVLQQLLEYDGGRTVVPMQFGMAFKDERTLQNLLSETRPAFTKALEEVENTVELGLKVITEAGADVDRSAIQAEVADRFDELAVSSTADDLFSERLVSNRSFLVDRDDREAFDQAVGEFEADHDDLLVQYTGPWPPYNFVDIQIGAKQ